MPKWADVVQEIITHPPPQHPSSPEDVVRRKYLQKYHQYTGRNVIAYYSGWLAVGNHPNISVNDNDTNGFMNAIHGLDCSKGLDLFLHTPGGAIAAAEHLVAYLKSKFQNDMRAIIPQMAMSAGTMIACSCKSIVMGKQSALGPIDPQYNNVPAKGVVEEFKRAVEECTKNPGALPIWQMIISKYHPTFIDSCEKAWQRSLRMVKAWLSENMLSNSGKREIDQIVKRLAQIGHGSGHDTHISQEQAAAIGLNIEKMEDDQNHQDLLLTIHHAYMHTIEKHKIAKVIENHEGQGIFYTITK